MVKLVSEQLAATLATPEGGRLWAKSTRGRSDLLFSISSQQSQVKESSQAPPMDVGGDDTGNGGGGGEGDLAARYERDLVHKLKLLRHELSLQQPQAGHCRIEVSREEIFEVGGELGQPLPGKTRRPSHRAHMRVCVC